MVIFILGGIIAILIIANLALFSIEPKNKYTLQHKNWKNNSTNKTIVKAQLVNPPIEKKIDEKEFLNFGKVIANEQKINLVNNRLYNLEKVVSEIGNKKLLIENNEEIDFEKINFKIKLLEQEIDNIKNPKEKTKTFYGKENDPMEATIKSLVFNSGRKK